MRFQVVPAAYVYFLRTHAGREQVLLQLREGTGYRNGHWATAAAGHVEAGESVIACALREAAEEIGVTPLDLAPLTSLHRTDGSEDPVEQRVDWIFTCRRWEGEPRILEPHKCADLRWFDLDDLPEPVVPHERLVIEGIARGDLPAIVAVGF